MVASGVGSLPRMGPTGGRKRSKSAFSRAGEVVSAHFAANVIWSTRKVSKGSIISKKSQLLVRPDTGDQPRGSEWNDFGVQNLARYLAETLSFAGCQIVVTHSKLPDRACYLVI